MNLTRYTIPLFGPPDPPDAVAAIPAAPEVAPPPAVEDPGLAEPRPVDPKTFIGEISKLRAERRELAERAEQASREAREAREMLARLQTPAGQTPPAPAPAAPAPAQNYDAEVNRMAQEIVLQRDFKNVSTAGIGRFGSDRWTDAVNALNAYGVNTPDFVGAVLEIDRERAHEIMHDIAQDGTRAMQLASMSPAQRIAEITRMSMAKSAPAPKEPPAEPAAPATPAAAPRAVSKAPPPPPAIEPAATRTIDWRSDEVSDEEFSKAWDANQAERVKRYRR